MACVALGASVTARVTPGGLKPSRRGAVARDADAVFPVRRSIRCDALDDARPVVHKKAPPVPRRGFMGTAAAVVAGVLPWSKDLAAFASGDPFPYPDVVTMQEAFWAKATKAAHPERWYPYWWALPLAPYGSKATAMAVVVPGEVWTFDQLQGLLDVLVNVRMTVIKLENGGLWVHNPVAPTNELMAMLAPIVDEHGPVKHIVVGSAAIEHKIYAGPFSKKFQAADVWLPPKNWSFPVDLPLETYVPYFPKGSPKTLPEDTRSGVGAVPWCEEIEHSVLQVGGSSLRNFSDPWFVDTAFYHQKTKTLLVTDAVLHVSPDPPPINSLDPEPLLVRGMDAPDLMLPNTREARSAGWGKTVLFGLLFQPAAVDVHIDLKKINKSFLDGFTWDEKWRDGFDNLCAKPLFVPPILQVLAFPRRRDEVKQWAQGVAQWDFERIIPSHLDGPIDAGPKEFARAMDVALGEDGHETFGDDVKTLVAIEKLSRDIKSLEEARPLTDDSPIKYYVKPGLDVETTAEAVSA
jgi:hypothetical protein